MAFNIGSYGGQQPTDQGFGIPSDPIAQQGLLAAMRAMNPTMQLLQPGQPQKPQQQQGGGSSGGTPINNMLFGQSTGTAADQNGLIGNGGFMNTIKGWGGNTPAGGQSPYGPAVQANGDMGFSPSDIGAPSPMMAPPPPMPAPAAAAPAASGGGMGMGGMDPTSMLGGAGGGAAGGAAGTDAAAGAGADAAAAALWIVCTEQHRQGKLPTRHYFYGAKVFAGYTKAQKRAYYKFAIPAVFHLRKQPDSRFSRFLGVVFRARAEHIAAGKGCPGARKSVLGAIVTHALPPIGSVLGTLFIRKPQDHSVVYRHG